jgi:hypothetical protein
LNSVAATGSTLWFSGLYTPGLLRIDGRGWGLAAALPEGTHNAQMLDAGVLYNDTAAERICYRRNDTLKSMPVPTFDASSILNVERFASSVARPRFARGLCVLGNGMIAGGSSPSTVSVYELESENRLLQYNLSMDVRNAIHGLAVWPFD